MSNLTATAAGIKQESGNAVLPYYFIDTHAHLDMLKQMTPEFAVSESAKQGVRYIINIGSSLSGSRKSSLYAGMFSNVFGSAGVHPHDAEKFSNNVLSQLESIIAANKKIVAVGETGFDYFRNLSPRDLQKSAFISQIELALKYGLPVIVHDRDAHDDMFEILDHYSSDKNFRAVIHCFSGSTGFAMKCLELGFFISFTGVITFPNARELVSTVSEVPVERMFLETDAPFLAPQEKRGRENYPGYIGYIARKISEIKEISLEDVAIITSENAERFFNLRPRQEKTG